MKKLKDNLFVKHLSNGWNLFFQDVIKWFLKLIPLVVIILVWVKIYWWMGFTSEKLLEIFQIKRFFPHIFSLMEIFIGIFIIVIMSYIFHHLTRIHIRLHHYIEKKIKQFPLAGPIYQGIKDFSQLLFSKKEKKWLVVLANTYGWDGYSIGIVYLTEDVLITNHVNIYIPSSPTPTSGMNFIINKKNVFVLEWVSITDATTYIFSLGINKIESFFENIKELEEIVRLDEFLKR